MIKKNTTQFFHPIKMFALISIFLLGSCKNDKGYSGFLQNESHTNFRKVVDITVPPKLLWKINTNASIVSSPIVHDNILYMGNQDGTMQAISALNGSILWKFNTSGAINSTPAISNEKLTFLSMDGYFYSIHATSGKLLWKFKTDGESKFKVKDYYTGEFKPDFWDFYLSSPIIHNDVVYFGSSDSNLYALNLNTGELVWKFKTMASIHSSPAYYNNKIIVGSWDSSVYALDASTGDLRWQFETGKDFEQYIWHGVQASPSVENDIVYVGSRDGSVYALNVETGKPIWSNDNFERSWMPSSIAIDENNIYTGSSDAFALFTLKKENGEIQYRTNTKTYTFSTPFVSLEMIYVGTAGGHLIGIDKKTGNILWDFKEATKTTDSIEMFMPDGSLHLENLKKLTKSVSDMPSLSKIYDQGFKNSGAILSTPTIENGILYFGTYSGHVYAIQ